MPTIRLCRSNLFLSASLVLATLCGMIAPSARAAEVSVLTYNIYMRAPTWMFWDSHDWRAAHIPRHLRGFDAVVLQEAFSNAHRNAIVAALADEYPHNTGSFGRDEFLSNNGGIIILSRWPIRQTDRHVFDTCDGSDCMVKKGVVYAEIEMPDLRLHLFGLHLQAQAEYQDARVAQFQQIRDFIDSRNIGETELVLAAGDFNVDYLSRDRNPEYDQLTETVGLEIPSGTPLPTYDVQTNSLVTESSSELLDYIFFSRHHLKPQTADYEMRVIREDDNDLSDHHAIAARFRVEAMP